jgi:septum formation inhibitor MinC
MSSPEAAFPRLHLRVHYDDGVPVLVVPDEIPLAGMKDYVRERIADVLPDLGGRAARIHLGEREIALFDLRRLLHMLRDEFQVEITGLYVKDLSVRRFAERELKLKLFVRAENQAPGQEAVPGDAEAAAAAAMPGMSDLLSALAEVADPTDAPTPARVADVAATTFEVDPADDDAAPQDGPADVDLDADDETTAEEPIPEAFDPPDARRRAIPLPELPRELDPDVDEMGGRRVLTLRRTLRSGTAIRYDGDVYVFGDVNAGAQVRAGGSVIVFGKLRGQVHAGAQGEESAFILAFDLASAQLRVARHIAIAPAHPRDTFVPEIATVADGQIVIEPYAGRVASRATRR